MSIDVERPADRRQRHWRAFPGWLISMFVHAVAGICCMFCFDFPTGTNGASDGLGDRPLQVITTISPDETPGPPETGWNVEMAQHEMDLRRDTAADIAPLAPQAQARAETPETGFEDVPSQDTPTEESAASETLVRTSHTRPIQRKYGHLLQQAVVSADFTSETRAHNRGTSGATGKRLNGLSTTAGTTFFEISAEGNLFCYVVDSSSSMDEGNSIDVARAELMASIEQLQATQRFQMLFYDSELHPLLDRGKHTFFATDESRKLARQFILSQQTHGGTVHLPALMAALKMAPEVIYFLTDGETPQPSARDLQKLKQANRQRTKIHVIQFGYVAKLEAFNWLEQLARDHRGSYRYQNVGG